MNDDFNLEKFYVGLEEAFLNKTPDKTEAYMKKWLRKAVISKNVTGEMAVSNELGCFYRAQGKTEAAERLLKNVLIYLEQQDGHKNTVEYATALINYGDVFVVEGDMKRALQSFLRSREIMESLGLEDDYRMAAVFNNSSAAYKALGLYKEAEEALEKSFGIISKLPNNKSQLAVIYTNLGEIQLAQGNLERSDFSFKKAIHLFEAISPDAVSGSGDVHYSAALAGYARLKHAQGYREEAEEMNEKAKRIRKRDYGV